MLNDSERRRLQAIEAALIGDDPSLARRLGGRSARQSAVLRRYAAVLVSVTGVSAVIVGLIFASTGVVVAGLVLVGVAGGIFTWPRARQDRT